MMPIMLTVATIHALTATATPTATSLAMMAAAAVADQPATPVTATPPPRSTVAPQAISVNATLAAITNRAHLATLDPLTVGLGGVIGGIGLTLLLLWMSQKVRQRRLLRVVQTHNMPVNAGGRLRTVVLRHLRETKGSLALAAAGVLGTTLTDLVSPWPLKLIFDYVLLQKELPATLATLDRWFAGNAFWLLTTLVGFYGLNALAGNGFAYLESYFTSRIGFQLVTTLRRELFIHLQRLSLSFHAQSQRGELLNKVSSDTQALREAFAEAGINLVTSVLTIVGMCLVMLLVNWRLSLIPLLSVPTLLLVYYWMQRKLKETARTQRKTEGRIAAQLSENLAIMPLVQAFGREPDEVRRFDDANSQNLDEGVQLARLNAGMSRTISLISTGGLLGVIFYGAWLTLNNQMTPGDVLLFVTYVKGLYKPIRDAVKLSSKITKAAVSAQRIDEILSLEPEITDKPNAIVARRLQGAIAFDQVSFGYQAAQPTIRAVSFTVAPGQRVALVGASGAGKSTITNLLLRLYEAQGGLITIDGVDLRDYDRQSLRRQIGLVLQEPFLMSGTLRENIAYGKLNATAAEIEAAARQAHIHDFIMTLPKRYETVIGELGNTLSGGQRQRIAIARALVKQPSILILDEPTSALDAASKTQVQETIDRLHGGRTILCITHQFSTVENFDRIMVMEGGQLVEQGTHRELLARNGVYARLYQLQHVTSSHPTPENSRRSTPTSARPALGVALQPALG